MSSKTILLIIDDETTVCNALRRLLRSKVDEILIAANSSDAENILNSKPVTHILCDHMLGPGQPKGLEIAQDWKQIHSSIQKIIILTGTTVYKKDAPVGIDCILPKITDPIDLISYLGF